MLLITGLVTCMIGCSEDTTNHAESTMEGIVAKNLSRVKVLLLSFCQSLLKRLFCYLTVVLQAPYGLFLTPIITHHFYFQEFIPLYLSTYARTQKKL